MQVITPATRAVTKVKKKGNVLASMTYVVKIMVRESDLL